VFEGEVFEGGKTFQFFLTGFRFVVGLVDKFGSVVFAEDALVKFHVIDVFPWSFVEIVSWVDMRDVYWVGGLFLFNLFDDVEFDFGR
jgi:hypothetical protein